MVFCKAIQILTAIQPEGHPFTGMKIKLNLMAFYCYFYSCIKNPKMKGLYCH